MNEFNQIESIINMFQKLINSVKFSKPNDLILEDITVSVSEINVYFYHTEKLRFQKTYDLNNPEEYAPFIEEMELLIEIWKQTLLHRSLPEIDAQFWNIYEFFKYVDADTIYTMVLNHFLQLPQHTLEQCTYVELWPFMDGLSINYKTQNFSLIRRYVDFLSNRYEDYKWFYEHLGDYRSKAILNNIISFWFTIDYNKLSAINENVFSDYYDFDILRFHPDAVIADLGAFNGDSALDYARIYKKFNKIYAYEITPNTYNQLVENVSKHPNIIPVNKGVSNISGKMYLKNTQFSAANSLCEQGDTEIDVVTLDDDIKEPIHMIKMDIEGAEKNALLGAKRHIKEDKPQLFISAYHVVEDIFDIPCIINSNFPHQKLLRNLEK